MQFSNYKVALLPVLAFGLLFACSLFSRSQGEQQPLPTQTKPSCPSLSKTFTERDLVGTWKASYSVKDKDVLIIRGDGTYKQTYENPGVVSIDTDWQKWWLEPRDSGYARLHLEGMRRCDLFVSLCKRTEGGLDPKEYTSIDPCEGGVIEMPYEVVLIVTGMDKEDPRVISLRQTRIAGSDWFWSFSREEEKP